MEGKTEQEGTRQVTPMALKISTLLATEAATLISAAQARTPALKDLWGCSILSSGIPNPRKKSMKLNYGKNFKQQGTLHPGAESQPLPSHPQKEPAQCSRPILTFRRGAN